MSAITRSKFFPFGVIFGIVLIVVAFTIPTIFGLQVTTMAVLALLGFALLISVVVYAFRKHRLHFGHLGFIIGVIFLVVGGTLFYGSISFSGVGLDQQPFFKEKDWELPSLGKGIALMMAGVGILLIFFGLRTLGANMYWWFRR